jgi:hypothetical protein
MSLHVPPATPARINQSQSRKKDRSVLSLLLLSILILLLAILKSSTPRPNFDGLLSPGQEKSVLILTAHPDDEVMFFSPSILGFLKSGWEVRGFCLSVGESNLLRSLFWRCTEQVRGV